MACPHTTSCPLFSQFRMKASLRVWQDFFCNGSFGSCQRYKLSQAGTRVPPNLLPNGKTLDLGLLGR